MIHCKKPIILIGFKHAGKTVIGNSLAKDLQADFTDLDGTIETHYEHIKGNRLSCRQIVRKEGIAYFRTLESERLYQVMNNNPSVLSLGGGTPLATCNQSLISQGTVIYITAPKGIVFERIMIKGRPAFFPEGEDAYDAFNRIWAERAPIYQQLADVIIDNTGSVQEAVSKIMKALMIEVVA